MRWFEVVGHNLQIFVMSKSRRVAADLVDFMTNNRRHVPSLYMSDNRTLLDIYA